MNMILSSNSCESIPITKSCAELPISILKNHIRPRNPWYPSKWLTGYENLRSQSPENPRNLAYSISQTCQKVLDSHLYLKKPKGKNWDKTVEGNFYERVGEWVSEKDKKLYWMRQQKKDTEVQGCTFRPETHRRGDRTTQLLIQDPPELKTTYSQQHLQKLDYRSRSKPKKCRKKYLDPKFNNSQYQHTRYKIRHHLK